MEIKIFLLKKNISNQLESAYDIFNNKSNFSDSSFRSDFFKDIKEQSKKDKNIKKPNNIISSQRMEMKNDFEEFNDNNNLARTQMIPDINYFDMINKKNKKNKNNIK